MLKLRPDMQALQQWSWKQKWTICTGATADDSMMVAKAGRKRGNLQVEMANGTKSGYTIQVSLLACSVKLFLFCCLLTCCIVACAYTGSAAENALTDESRLLGSGC